MKCNKCNKENPENSKFCSHCGDELEKENISKRTIEATPPKTYYNTAIIIVLVIGAVIFGYGYMNYDAKMKAIEADKQAKAEEIKRLDDKESTRKTNLFNCNLAAETDYNTYWNAQCPIRGVNKKTEDCSLPSNLADSIEARKEKAIDNCIKLYGN